jgi:hypothetical protein
MYCLILQPSGRIVGPMSQGAAKDLQAKLPPGVPGLVKRMVCPSEFTEFVHIKNDPVKREKFLKKMKARI